MAEKKSRWPLINRLRTAIKKVTFIMNFNLNRWRFSSMVGGGSRRLSFNDRPAGLTAAIVSGEDYEYSPDERELKRTQSFPLQRTMSSPEEDDIDKRADMFIANFYRQLKMERQVSLQLRYRRDTSFGSSNSYSP